MGKGFVFTVGWGCGGYVACMGAIEIRRWRREGWGPKMMEEHMSCS